MQNLQTITLLRHQKVAIVGVGAVGAATAYSLVCQNVCDEILLINRNRKKSEGEALDLQQSVGYLGRNMHIYAGEYADCYNANVVVISLGAPPRPDQSRLEMLDDACNIVKPAVEAIMKSGFNGFFVIVTNPVDVISHFVYKLSGLPKERIIGTGTALDSVRLRSFIGEKINIDPHSINAYVLGEHGSSQVIPWSLVNVGGKELTKIIQDNPDFQSINLDELHQHTVNAGYEIAKLKGFTYLGIATTAVAIIRAILFDQNRVMPVSTYLEGEYGEHDVFAGLPVILDGTGVRDVFELHLAPDEEYLLHKSIAVIKEYTQKTLKHY